jgi:hypothetical protein
MSTYVTFSVNMLLWLRRGWQRWSGGKHRLRIGAAVGWQTSGALPAPSPAGDVPSRREAVARHQQRLSVRTRASTGACSPPLVRRYMTTNAPYLIFNL